MKVVVFEAEDRERSAFDRLRPAHEVVFVADPLKPSNVKEHADADVVSTFIYSELGLNVIEQLPRLKLIATRSTGYEHINVEECGRRGIAVCNVPTYGANTPIDDTGCNPRGIYRWTAYDPRAEIILPATASNGVGFLLVTLGGAITVIVDSKVLQ